MAEGARGLPVRRRHAAARRGAEARGGAGGKVEACLLAYGEHDVNVVTELPDAAACLALSLAASTAPAPCGCPPRR